MFYFSRFGCREALLLLSLCLFPFLLQSQDVGEPEMQQVTSREWELELFLNTSGGGGGFQYGWTPDYFNKHFWEINFWYHHPAKAVRGRNSIYTDGRAFSYGRQYYLFFLRAGYGYQRTLHHKPYWGGVQIRFTFSGGFTLGMGIPVYLEILKLNEEGHYYYEEIERYDPENYDQDLSNIIGNAGFFKGIGKTAFRPGFYAKTGLQFDFSKDNMKIHVVEVGVTVDMIFPYLQEMAYSKVNPCYVNAYIAYHFGKKKLIYE